MLALIASHNYRSDIGARTSGLLLASDYISTRDVLLICFACGLARRVSTTNISLAPSRSFKDSEGNRQSETEWHRITCFNGVGKSVAEHVAKGAMVMVTGRIHYTKWTDQNGTDRYGCEIIAEQVDFLAKAKEAASDEPKKRRSK